MLADFLQYEFLQRAFEAGLIIGLISPLVGVFLAVRRLSLIAEALSHVTLSGVAAGLFLQKKVALPINPIYIGMAFSVAGSLFVEQLRRFYRSYQELAIPILLSGGIAIGVVLISAADGFNVEVASYLFGNILAVTSSELELIRWIGMITVLFILIAYKQLFSLSFDEENAILSGVPRRLINLLFIVVVALVIASSIRVVGVLLVSALMTLPVATSLQHTLSFRQTLLWSVIYAEISVIIGFAASYLFNIASGGAIVLVSLFLLFLVITGKRMGRWMRTKERSS